MTSAISNHPTLVQANLPWQPVMDHLNQVGWPVLAQLGFPTQAKLATGRGRFSVPALTLELPALAYKPTYHGGYHYAAGAVIARISLARFKSGLILLLDTATPNGDMCIDYDVRRRFLNLLATLETDPARWRVAGLKLIAATHHWLTTYHGMFLHEGLYEEIDWGDVDG